MDNKNSIVKFEDIELQISINKDYELEMDMEELSKAIGFKGNETLKKMITRNLSLQDREFSYLKKVLNEEGGVLKKREKRIFTQDGIYEVALLANTERAKKFRKFARHLITNFRRNELVINQSFSIDNSKKLDEIKEIIISNDNELQKILNFIDEAKENFDKLGKMAESIKKLENDVALIKIELNELTEDYGVDEDCER